MIRILRNLLLESMPEGMGTFEFHHNVELIRYFGYQELAQALLDNRFMVDGRWFLEQPQIKKIFEVCT